MSAPQITKMTAAALPVLVIVAVILMKHLVEAKERRSSIAKLRAAGEGAYVFPPSNRKIIRDLISICSILSDEERQEAILAGERCRQIEDYVPELTGDGRRLVSDILKQVSAAHGRALKYAGPDDAEPLARRVLDALRAAGEEAESLRISLLSAETDSLATLGRYLDGRRGAGGLTSVP